MKQLPLIILLITFAFGEDNFAKLLQPHLDKLPQELQQQLLKKPITWKNIPGRQLNRSMMDPSDLLGEWELEDQEATMWVTVGTDQTVPNFMQVMGWEPAEGGIGISGSAVDTMDYMMAMAQSYYGYGEIAMVQLSNNSLMMDDYYYYDDFPEDLELPLYSLMYTSMMGYTFAEFMVVDTAEGEMVENYFEIENAGDFITIDTTSMSVDIAALTVANDAGDLTYTISGAIVPGTIDLVADVPTELPFLVDDFGPGDDDEIVTFQFFEDGTGYEIYSGFDDDYYYGYYEYTDTSAIEWSATNDSLTLIFTDYDDYYGYEYSDTTTLAYVIEDDMLSLSAEFDFCEDDYYYYYYDDCYEMFEMQFGITDIQDITLDFSMEMSYNGPLAIAGEIVLQPDEFIIHRAYPNPFNPTTTLKYEMGSAGPVSIDVLDVSGRKIRSLYNGIQSPGQHEIRWDARDDRGRSMSSGVYLFKVNVNGKQQTAKTLLLK